MDKQSRCGGSKQDVYAGECWSPVFTGRAMNGGYASAIGCGGDSPLRLPVRMGSCSRQGKRGRNEDSCSIDSALSFAAVSDGIGGAPFGDVASRVACNAAIEGFRACGDVEGAFRHAAEAVAKVMAWLGPESANSGATLLVASCDGLTLRLAWAGDTVAFRARSGSLELLTPAHRGCRPNVITSGVGAWASPGFGRLDFGLLPADRILLCTDGVWAGRLGERVLLEELARDDNPGLVAMAIADKARSLGDDDATAVVLVADPPDPS